MATHKDVEFHVSEGNLSETNIYKSFDKAMVAAAILALSRGFAQVDVVIWSRSGARAFEGDEGVAQYDEDPDASVYRRFTLRGTDMGRVP